MSLLDSRLWDIVGLLMAGVAGYFIVTRTLLPQFAFPWFGKRDRQRAIERVDQLLTEADLSDEERQSLRRCRNTLLAYDGAPRELWSGNMPISDVVDEIDSIWEKRCGSEK